jgi:hypothetical protein
LVAAVPVQVVAVVQVVFFIPQVCYSMVEKIIKLLLALLVTAAVTEHLHQSMA